MLNLFIQYLVAFEPNRIGLIFQFQETINVRIGEGCVPPEESRDVIGAVTSDNGLQNTPPVISTVDIAMTKKGSFQVTILIEAEQWVITGALEVYSGTAIKYNNQI